MAQSRFKSIRLSEASLLWQWPEVSLALPPPAPYALGVLNVTPDSFSDGGVYLDAEKALRGASRMAEEGAVIIDVGAQSTRPGYARVSEDEERRRVLPVLRAIKEALSAKTLVSIDTDKAGLADEALRDGLADLINDTSGGDVNMARVAARYGVPLILTHIPESAGHGSLSAVARDLDALRKVYVKAGLPQDCIALDPGLGFNKTNEESLALLRECAKLLDLGSPLCVGASRKRFIGEATRNPDPVSRLGGSLAAVVWAALEGVSFVRVHDVKETAQALAMIAALKRA